MNLRTLQYLVAIAEHKHFGRAAQACFVSQPTLSMQIKKLEEWLGIQLIERTNKSVQLTAVGEQIAERARNISQDVSELKTFAQCARDPLAGECRLGLIHTIAPYLLPHFIPKLKKSLPNLTCYLIEDQTDPLTLQLLQGKCDVMIAALPITHPQIESIPLYDEPFYLAVEKTHPMATRKQIDVSHLNEEPLLLLREGHCLRDQALEVCQQAMHAQQEHFQATSIETLRHMVAAGLGCTLMPALVKRQDRGRQVSYIPFKKPEPVRTVGLCWRKTNARRPLFETLAQAIQAALPFDEIHLR